MKRNLNLIWKDWQPEVTKGRNFVECRWTTSTPLKKDSRSFAQLPTCPCFCYLCYWNTLFSFFIGAYVRPLYFHLEIMVWNWRFSSYNIVKIRLRPPLHFIPLDSAIYLLSVNVLKCVLRHRFCEKHVIETWPNAARQDGGLHNYVRN